jgi:hypothetical protein
MVRERVNARLAGKPCALGQQRWPTAHQCARGARQAWAHGEMRIHGGNAKSPGEVLVPPACITALRGQDRLCIERGR